MKYGYEEGEVCGRNGCKGVIELPPVEGCTCHINPPCSACMNNQVICPVCGWQYNEEEERAMPESEFDLGQTVFATDDLMDVAAGKRQKPTERTVTAITMNADGFKIQTDHCRTHDESSLVHKDDAHNFAVSWLADRLVKVAGMSFE